MSELQTGATYAEWAEYNRGQMARDRNRFIGAVKTWPVVPAGVSIPPDMWRSIEVGMRAQRDSLIENGCTEPTARRVTELSWFESPEAALEYLESHR